MIRLKNVSKFYYSKGLIASGMTKVNLDLHVGEFVVITGESGSGKSTLLNVISGLDSYEEGELYIDGQETSHYTSKDFEEYRKKYIGNIFQHFNLVNSYTVYQNVELILLTNGTPKEEIKKVVPSIIEKVGLSEYSKTKISKLSGGQKQRVAIARALAKDTSVIVADEPTGNLDSVSAEGIVSLLTEIAKEKLVVVVTHNFDQFEAHATRVIKMHDGKMVEDRIQKKPEIEEKTEAKEIKNKEESITVGSKVRLGGRNTFNVIPKFFLLLIVFIFVVMSVTSQYTSFKKQDEEAKKLGYNNVFANYSEDRIVFAKKDKTEVTDADFEQVAGVANVKSIVKDDVLLDTLIYMESENFDFSGFPYSINSLNGKVDIGELPSAPNEVVLAGAKDAYYFNGDPSGLVGKEYTISIGEDYRSTAKIVGVKYTKTKEGGSASFMENGRIYTTDAYLAQLRRASYQSYSKVTTTINGKNYVQQAGSVQYKVVPSDKVAAGKAVVPDDVNTMYTWGSALNKKINVNVSNIYYKQDLPLTISGSYVKSTMEKKTGQKDYENHNGEIYINPNDYINLFDKGNYQSSVVVKDPKQAEATGKALNEMGYKTIVLKNTLVKFTETELVNVVQVPMAVFLIVIMFFISYFVTQLILKSRNSYFSILRMLGMDKKAIKRILDIELFFIMNIAFGLFALFVELVRKGLIHVAYIKNLIQYLTTTDYVILYLFLIVLTFLISTKFANSMFKKTAMGSFREEA